MARDFIAEMDIDTDYCMIISVIIMTIIIHYYVYCYNSYSYYYCIGRVFHLSGFFFTIHCSLFIMYY